MGSRAMLMINMFSPKPKHFPCIFFNLGRTNLLSSFYRRTIQQSNIKNQITRNYSAQKSGLEPPDVSRLAETARISLTPNEVHEFGPKINEVINWFGQLEDVDLENIEPALRADTETDNIRHDLPETFANRESIISALPSYEEPYVKVPKVLNKE